MKKNKTKKSHAPVPLIGQIRNHTSINVHNFVSVGSLRHETDQIKPNMVGAINLHGECHCMLCNEKVSDNGRSQRRALARVPEIEVPFMI